MQKVVVLGATSGIAQEVQKLLASKGKEMMLVARSPERLSVIQSDLRVRGAREVVIFTADLADTSTHLPVLEFARKHLGNFDTILLAYGTMLDQQECQHSATLARQEIETNFVSAAALLTISRSTLRVRARAALQQSPLWLAIADAARTTCMAPPRAL